MALCTPSDLSLATLGLISSNIAKTNEVELDNDCGEGDEDNTSMWASFKIGDSLAVPVSGTFDGAGTNRGYFKIKVKGDVGEYMGGTSSGEFVSSSLNNQVNFGESYTFYIDETNPGAYYSKILGNSSNAGDYEGDYVPSTGADGFASAAIVQQSTKDTFIATGTGSGP
tara:strand:+ start:52 stop:558 length:507 start_codon:yes stop_codon:yes gene_type:complete